MRSIQNFTAIIEKEDDSYVALYPELDVASQGDSIEETKKNLQEAIELFLGYSSKKEMMLRLKNNFFIKNPERPITNFANPRLLNS